MVTWTNIDHFEGEDVLITIEEEGKDTVTNFEGKISNIDVSGGTENTEDVFLFGGKTINFAKPKEKFMVKFDFITPDTTMSQLKLGGTGGASSELRSSNNANRYRIILWFLPASQMKTGTGGIVTPSTASDDSKNTRRMIFTDCKSVELTTTFAADDMLKGNISFEFSATDADGYANYFDEYTTSTSSTLTTLTATAHKGTLTWTGTATPGWTGSYRT